MATSLYKAQKALKTCDEHEHKELSFFCKTCKKFICILCGKTTHLSHDWDLIASVAKVRRNETPQLCRNIKKEKLRKYQEKLRGIDKDIEKSRQEDIAKLEERRTTFIDVVNSIIDEQKRKRNDLARETSETNRALEKKVEYLEKMTTRLDNNIAAYSEFDLLEMEQAMLTALKYVEPYIVNIAASAVNFAPGEINQRMIAEMVGVIEETTLPNVDGNLSVKKLNSLNVFNGSIRTIFPVSDTQAWTDDYESNEIKLLSVQNVETKRMTFESYNGFIALDNGDFIMTGYMKQGIRRVSSTGEESVIVSTKPLHPMTINKTKTDDIIVSLRDDGDRYNLKSSSRRVVQRITFTPTYVVTRLCHLNYFATVR